FDQEGSACSQTEDQQSSLKLRIERREVQGNDHQEWREDEVCGEHLENEGPVFQMRCDRRQLLRQPDVQHSCDHKYWCYVSDGGSKKHKHGKRLNKTHAGSN